MVAENDQRRPLGVQFRQVLRNGTHGNQPGAFDAADGVLFRLPNINQAQGFASIEAFLHLAGVNFERDFGHDENVISAHGSETRPENPASDPLVILRG